MRWQHSDTTSAARAGLMGSMINLAQSRIGRVDVARTRHAGRSTGGLITIFEPMDVDIRRSSLPTYLALEVGRYLRP